MLDVSCYCTTARRLSRALTAAYDTALASSGLKVTQFSLLRAVERLEAPMITEVAEATGLDRSTLGRNLRVLLREGFVELGPGEDERTRLVALTRKGRAAMARALPLWERCQRRLGSASSPEDRAALDRLSRHLATFAA